jgi:hypothetical protein
MQRAVAVGDNGSIYTSTNGTGWSKASLTVTNYVGTNIVITNTTFDTLGLIWTNLPAFTTYSLPRTHYSPHQRKKSKNGVDTGSRRQKMGGDGPTQKRFSLNRAASRKQFPKSRVSLEAAQQSLPSLRDMSEHRRCGLILLSQLVLLATLGWWFRHALNPDAVAYLRLAHYYAAGNFELAVSGYWGPLLSWWLALGLKCGLAPLATVRVVMAGSALFFTWGAYRIYRAVPLSRGWTFGGLIIVALAGSWWSVQFITPDLLLSGVWLLALSLMRQPDWAHRWPRAGAVGALWGAAYLIKAITLPLAVLVLLVFGIRALRHAPRDRRVILRSLTSAALALGIVASPWIAVLSAKYERLTFSTTPPITHTLTGPPDVDRYHPFARSFHVPETGRVTSWEEPSRMDYQRWSPWANRAYAMHQIRVVLRNIVTIGVLWTSLNLAALSLFWVWWRAERGSMLRQQLGALLLLPVGLALIYLPCFLTFTEQRFFYVTLPLFFAAVACWADLSANGTSRRWRAWMGWGCAVGPLLAQMVLIGNHTSSAGECARQLADTMRAAQLVGPVAGSANLPGGRTGLYVAFHLQQPWHGDKLSPTPAEIAVSGAKYFLVHRDLPLAAQLRSDSRFVDLDERLFAVSAAEVGFPVQAFEIRPAENRTAQRPESNY